MEFQFGKRICYVDVWKSLIFGSDLTENGDLFTINETLHFFLMMKMKNSNVSKMVRLNFWPRRL